MYIFQQPLHKPMRELSLPLSNNHNLNQKFSTNISIENWKTIIYKLTVWGGSHHGHDRMVVGFTTTYASSAYHHSRECKFWSGQGVQHYVIKVVNDLRQFSSGPLVSSTNKKYLHDITELMLKMALPNV